MAFVVGLAVEDVTGGPGSFHDGSLLAKWFIHWEAEKASGLAGWRGGSGGAAVAGLGLPQREPAKTPVSSRVLKCQHPHTVVGGDALRRGSSLGWAIIVFAQWRQH